MPGWDETKNPKDKLGRWAAKGEAAGKAQEGAMALRLARAKAGAPKKAPAAPLPALDAKEVPASDFKKAFDAAFKDHPRKHFVSHYSEDELKGMKTYTAEGGKVGAVVKDHGDGRIEASAVFNNGGPRGGGQAMLKHLVDTAGVNYVECYGQALSDIYAKVGFVEQTKEKFNREYAAPGWDFKQFDSPKYRTMKRG